MSDDGEKLFELYKEIKSENNEGDYKKQAMNILMCGNLKYLAGIKEGLEPHQLNEMYNETMKKYRDIVDSRDKLDNYSQAFINFQKTLPNRREIKNMKDKPMDPTKYINLLKCKGKYEPCKSMEVTQEDVRKLFTPKAPKTEDPVDPENLFDDSVGNDTLEAINTAELMHSPEFKPTFRRPEEFAGPDQKYKEFPKANPLFQSNPRPTTLRNQDSGSKINAMSEFLFNRPKVAQNTKNFDEGASSSRGFSRYPQVPDRNPQIPERNPQIPARNDKNDENVGASSKYPDFVSSRDVLKLQNFQKYGNPNYIQPSTAPKKSLGGKRFISRISPMTCDGSGGEGSSRKGDSDELMDERLKNLDPHIVEHIKSEIMENFPPVTWDDIVGLEYAKQMIKEAVVLPLLRPDIFTGLRAPPKGILLFGPPGTGKTMIGRCIASQSKSTFFNIASSSLVSKWIGEGEKAVRTLFTLARIQQPSVIFIDEIDSLLSQRSDTEHESSRRLKTEFFIQMDGVGTDENDKVLIVAATNLPQNLDDAARRRFTKKLYIALPEDEARVKIVQSLLKANTYQLSVSDLKEIAELTEGFSGADMKVLCQEASMIPLRFMNFTQISSMSATQVRPIELEDFKEALQSVRPTVSKHQLDQYLQWDRTFGAGRK